MNTQNPFRAESLPARIFSLGREKFEALGNKEISELVGMDHQGTVSGARIAVSKKTGWIMKGELAPRTADDSNPRQHGDKPARKVGSLPMVFEGFLLGQDIEELTQEHILDFVKMDTPGWNRFVRRMENADDSHVRSFERWLGHGATMSRQSEFLATARKCEIESKMEKIMAIIGEDTELANLLIKTLVR